MRKLYFTRPVSQDEIALEDLMDDEALANLDLFDALQLKSVIGICRQSRPISDAGRKLYAASRATKAKPNDADRLKKYLNRFGLNGDLVMTCTMRATTRKKTAPEGAVLVCVARRRLSLR